MKVGASPGGCAPPSWGSGGMEPAAGPGCYSTLAAPFSLSSAEQYKLLSDHIEQMATE